MPTLNQLVRKGREKSVYKSNSPRLIVGDGRTRTDMTVRRLPVLFS